MSTDTEAFTGGALGLPDVDHAPGQRSHGEPDADLVDFSHGDVDAFPPYPAAFEAVARAYAQGAAMAYSEYRGHRRVRAPLAGRLAALTGAPVDPDRELIITPGTETGLFLALSCLVSPGDRVAIVEPDYFANRKIVQYLRGEILPVRLDYLHDAPAELDLEQLREAVRQGARVICLSNPNNPTGVVYSRAQLQDIVAIARDGGAFVVADQLYSRLIYAGVDYTSLRSIDSAADMCVTLVGPSKTESLSGFRVGTALGPAWLIDRMEKLLSIVSLRTAGYNQAALHSWLTEPAGWLTERIDAHQRIRDELLARLRSVEGMRVRTTEGGSYLFAHLPELTVTTDELVDRAQREARVVVTRGVEFGPGVVDNVRFNFSQDRKRARLAVDRFAALVDSLRH